MSLITVSIKHGQPLDDARRSLRLSVGDIHAKFGMMIQRVDWSADGDQVKLTGKGIEIDMRLDAEHLHVSGNLTFLGGLLAGPLAAGVKQILGRNFPRQLT